MGQERADLRSERSDLRSKRPFLGSKGLHLQSGKPVLRLRGGWTDRWKPQKIAPCGIKDH